MVLIVGAQTSAPDTDNEMNWLYLPMAFSQYQEIIGWAVGTSSDGYGTILHTTDSGITWVRQGSPDQIPNQNLTDVSAVDALNAWAAGKNAILRTQDGGQTWVTQTLPAGLPDGFSFQGINALDADTVYVVGWPSVMLHTTNGLTWSQMPASATMPDNINFQGVDAADSSHIWAVGGTQVGMNRKDPIIAFYNGLQWDLQATKVFTDPNITSFIGVSAIDAQHAWAVGGWRMPLATTADGGATWQFTGQELSATDMNRVVAVSPTTGWVSGDYSNVIYTTDAGATWYHINVPGMYLFGITAMDEKTAWVVGIGVHGAPPGSIARTLDAIHWQLQSDPAWPNFSGISFVGARR